MQGSLFVKHTIEEHNNLWKEITLQQLDKGQSNLAKQVKFYMDKVSIDTNRLTY